MSMKIVRSTKLTLKFANDGKKQRLRIIMSEYSKVVNFFIDLFWEPTHYQNATPKSSPCHSRYMALC